MLVHKFENTLSLRESSEFIRNFEEVGETEINLDLTNLNYVDTTGSNILLLLPFYLKELGYEVSLTINPNSNMTAWIKSIGILDKFQDSFKVNLNKPPKQKTKLDSTKVEFQRRIANVLQTNPLLRTFFAKDRYDARILSEIQNFSNKILMKRFNLSNKISTCIVELINNVFDHSEEKFGAIAIHFLRSQHKVPHVHLAVTDFGIGIKNSLLKSNSFQNYKDENDSFFIDKALGFNVSSTDKPNRGFGLSLVAKSADALHISSGFGSISIRTKNEKKIMKKREIPELIGTSITCILKTEKADNTI